MRLNTLRPASGSRAPRTRVGRGIGSGKGKTCGRGHKGQLARSGATRRRMGFEGGQMALQRRLPKFGFTSRKGRYTTEITLSDLGRLSDTMVSLETLQKSGLINKRMRRVKIIKSGEIDKAYTISGLFPTKGAREMIEKLGGKIVEG